MVDKDAAQESPYRYAALKIVKSARHYKEAAEDEVKLLRAIRDTDPVALGRKRAVLLLDDFKHYGPHGTHICMVMEVLGHNLLKLIKSHDYKGVPMGLLRRIIRQCLEVSGGAFPDFAHGRMIRTEAALRVRDCFPDVCMCQGRITIFVWVHIVTDKEKMLTCKFVRCHLLHNVTLQRPWRTCTNIAK